MQSVPIVRSLLFVPGSRPDRFAKAVATGVDALAIDLEDSVPPDGKEAARAAVKAELAQSPGRVTFVRINHASLGFLDADLAVLGPHPAHVVMAPKVDGPQDIEELDERLAVLERKAGLDANSLGVMVIIEGALGLRNLFDTLRSSARVRGAALASAEEGDFMIDIGGRWTPEGDALAYARGKFVCDARAAQVPWLFDGAFMNLTDDAALRKECQLARSYGFNSKGAIHPRQVAIINEVFSPSEADIGRARKLIEAFRRAEAEGRGAITFDGMMVDYANVKRAEQLLALADRLASGSGQGAA